MGCAGWCFCGRNRGKKIKNPTQFNSLNNPMTKSTPKQIGILAAEIYIPNTFVSQKDLEIYDGVSSGKYTAGLMQEGMAFVLDNEDVVSMCLTVTSQLLERMSIDKQNIGRIEVGTETIQDKSKSIKSYLMQLFPNNTDICGVDNLNACYGGTASLLNTVAWMESEDWDGRLGMVIISDIAIYEMGPARPTGGAGAIALLIGPNAPIVIERGTSAHFMQHAYDFYKPNPSSEYPIVDGQASISCYLSALDSCYNLHLDKINRKSNSDDHSLDSFDYFIFHSPYGKLVQKALGRLIFNDSLRDQTKYPMLQPYRDVLPYFTIGNRGLDKLLADLSKEKFNKMTLPSRYISSNVGNSYCASLYSGLVSLLCILEGQMEIGSRIGMFSYGSGLAATMFSLIVASPPVGVTAPSHEIKSTLKNRICLLPEEFVKVLEERESYYSKNDWSPKSDINSLRPGTFYLEQVDSQFRRFYNRK